MQRIKRMHKTARLGLILFSGIMLAMGFILSAFDPEFLLGVIASIVAFCIFWLLIRFWLWIYDRFWTRLTCEGQLHEGPRRLLIAVSAPFFSLLIVPGILFWLLVWCVLWIKAGYKAESSTRLAPQGTDSATPRNQS